MPVIDFIRGKDKRRAVLLNLESMTIIPNVKRANEETGEYWVFLVDSQGKLVRPVTLEKHQGRIRILTVALDSDYRVLPKNSGESIA